MRQSLFVLILISGLGLFGPSLSHAAKGPKCGGATLEKIAGLAPLSVPKAHDQFRSSVASAIAGALPPEAALHAEQIEAMIESPPNFEMGQAAFPCFTLAKAMKTSPVKIAEMLRDRINGGTPGDSVGAVTAAGPYLNFKMDFNRYGDWVSERIRSGKHFTSKFEDGQSPETIDIEFSQPNTHKALHVGHLRNMIHGEAVARLLEGAGHKVVRSTYPGDLGTHIAKVLWYIQTQKKGELPSKDRASWLGRMYAEADQYIKDQTDPAIAARIKGEIETTLRNIETHQGDVYPLYQTTREWSLDQMRDTYDWLGVKFDKWYFESECDEPSRKLVEEKLAQNFFTKSDGAVGIDLSQHGLPFAMVLTSSGNGLYLTKDLELLRRKFDNPKTSRSLVVVDERQKLHFQQVFKIAELMGYPQATRSAHLSYATVNDADGNAFSSRTMNGMELGQIRERLEGELADKLRSKYGSLSEGALKDLARDYALATMKLGFLKVDAETPIRFDLNDWLKTEGDTASSIFSTLSQTRRAMKEQGAAASSAKIDAKTEAERQLIQHLGRYPAIKLDAAQRYKPSLVTNYLFDLNRRYQRVQAENGAKPLSDGEKLLVENTEAVLENGLELLGVRVPKAL